MGFLFLLRSNEASKPETPIEKESSQQFIKQLQLKLQIT